MKKLLTKLQEDALQSFFDQPIGASYFLTGGTALAGFYFHHRESIDLDLFTFETIETEPVRQVLQDIAESSRLSVDHRVATAGYHKFFLTGKKAELKIDIVKEQKVHFGKIKAFGKIRVDSEVKNLKNFPRMLVPFDKDRMENYFVSLANNLLLKSKPQEL